MVGCFSEAQSAGDGAGCDLGAAGCPCDHGACADALACMSELDLCIPAGCDPGTELCTCYDGECFGDLRCEGGLCRPPSHGTDESTVGGNTGSSAGETIADASSQSGSEVGETTAGSTFTTTMPGDTGAMTDPTAESGMPTTDAEDTGIDGGPCHDCTSASLAMGGDCEMAFFGCAPNGECTMLVDCVLAALDADDSAGIPACCDAHPPGAPAYDDLAGCWSGVCPMACGGITLSCGG